MAPVSGGMDAADGDTGAAYLFGQALAVAQTDETGSAPDAASSEKTEDTQGQAEGTAMGELSPDLLAVLLGQQMPQPTVAPAEAQTAAVAPEEALPQATASTGMSLTVPQASGGPQSAAVALVANPHLASTLNQAPVIADDAADGTGEGMSDDKMPGSVESKASPATTQGEARSLSDTLKGLSGALTGASTQQDGTPAPPPSQAATQSALSHIQAQTLPQGDSGVRFTPAPPTAQQTVQTYSQSAQAAENIAALSAQITRRLGSKSTSFDMELRPTDMGKVEVKLEIGHDGKLTAHLRFDSPVAESEFKGRQDDLRRQLEQAGFQMDDASLSFTSGDQGRGRQYTAAESSDYELPVTEPEAVIADTHSLIDAQLMAAASVDPSPYAQMTANGYGPARTLSLSVLV